MLQADCRSPRLLPFRGIFVQGRKLRLAVAVLEFVFGYIGTKYDRVDAARFLRRISKAAHNEHNEQAFIHVIEGDTSLMGHTDGRTS